MRELIDTLQRVGRPGRRDRAGRSSSGTFGSAPRPEGAVLLGADDGRLAGSVSGGCVEGAAYGEIERAQRDGHARVIRYGISDEQAWDVGLACGGTIDVLVEPSVPAVGGRGGDGRRAGHGRGRATPRRHAAAGVRPAHAGRRGTARGPAHRPRGRSAARRRRRSPRRPAIPRSDAELVRERARRTRAGDCRGRSWPATASGSSRRYPVRPRLVIVGAVQVAIPLVRLARELGFETVVVDGRPAFATAERFPDADRLVVGWPDEVADRSGSGPRTRSPS